MAMGKNISHVRWPWPIVISDLFCTYSKIGLHIQKQYLNTKVCVILSKCVFCHSLSGL